MHSTIDIINSNVSLTFLYSPLGKENLENALIRLNPPPERFPSSLAPPTGYFSPRPFGERDRVRVRNESS